MRATIGLVLVAAVSCLAGCFSVTGGGAEGPLKKTLGPCSPEPCVAVDIDGLPELPHTVSPSAREVIKGELRQVLYAPLDIETKTPSLKSLLGELEERLREYDGLSDAPVDWKLTRKALLLYSDKKITSCEVTNQGYLGGAHGFNDRMLMTFDSQTGQRLGVTDVVADQSQRTLSKVVEAEFRRARSIRLGQSLQDAGFFILPGQELPLGENFALTDRGMEIQYNPYEVAPYALGETRVRVPSEAVAPLVKAELQEVFTAGSSEAINR
ncbi:MAG: RsiV family protein [Pseudomonadota bacterium]|jgi:hypothetical protein